MKLIYLEESTINLELLEVDIGMEALMINAILGPNSTQVSKGMDG